MSKPKIHFTPNSEEDLGKALSISEERAKELEYRAELITHDYWRPRRDNILPSTIDNILMPMIAIAENEQELVFCAHLAGISTASVFQSLDEAEEEDGE